MRATAPETDRAISDQESWPVQENGAGEQFGSERLGRDCQAIQRPRTGRAYRRALQLSADLAQGTPQQNDLTAVLLKRSLEAR